MSQPQGGIIRREKAVCAGRRAGGSLKAARTREMSFPRPPTGEPFESRNSTLPTKAAEGL